METRNHCSGAGGGGRERGWERSPGREAGEALARLTSVFLFRALFISPPPAALLPQRALRAGASRRRLLRASVTSVEILGTPAPRAPAGRHREGWGPRQARGSRRGLRKGSALPAPGDWEATFPALCLRVGSWPRPLAPGAASRPARGQAQPGATAPCAPCERAAPELRRPGGPSRAQTFAPVPGALPRHVKPPGTRAAARLTPRAGARGRDAPPRPGAATWLLLALPVAALRPPPTLGFRAGDEGEPQKSCSKVTDSCQHICQCRPPPLLPPPPPPPPPPRLLSSPPPNSTPCPTEESWRSGLVIIVAVCCASLVFLTVLVIICYKAIKRKPLRKDENGTSVAEYPMTSSQSNKGADVNNAVV